MLYELNSEHPALCCRRCCCCCCCCCCLFPLLQELATLGELRRQKCLGFLLAPQPFDPRRSLLLKAPLVLVVVAGEEAEECLGLGSPQPRLQPRHRTALVVSDGGDVGSSRAVLFLLVVIFWAPLASVLLQTQTKAALPDAVHHGHLYVPLILLPLVFCSEDRPQKVGPKAMGRLCEDEQAARGRFDDELPEKDEIRAAEAPRILCDHI